MIRTLPYLEEQKNSEKIPEDIFRIQMFFESIEVIFQEKVTC